ncbi:MAG: 1-acyl-sn-glycerol-3-phosphate acyltransferase [Planctomycetes bacterium]|nr:1-acyl-sn-glycerol-3-phosphate acyltransferase [Planctomycetota bacterium]
MRIWPLLWRLCEILPRWLWHLRLALEVRGVCHLTTGPVLLCAKHASAFDILLLGHLSRTRMRRLPHFQMGSFIGYRLLGPLSPLLCRLGGFPVMRPKEVRRLAERSGDRAAALETMRRVNAVAEDTRREVLASGGVLVVFPEGTRDAGALRGMKGTLEVESALAVLMAGIPVCVVPTAISYARKRLFRRRVVVEFCPGFVPQITDSAASVLARVQAALEAHWIPPAQMGMHRKVGAQQSEEVMS